MRGQRKALRFLQTKAAIERRLASPILLAYVYSGLGDKDQSFAWLEKAFTLRVLDVTTIKSCPLWDPLRPDPRFAGLLRRLNLPE